MSITDKVIQQMREPEVTTNSQKIDKLIRRISDGDIKVPAFQRGFVWKQEQVINLLESIFSDFPIGSILLWEASENEKLRSTRNIAGYIIPDRPESYPVNYVLDGQQRLSSIYAVFSECVEQDNNSGRYNPNIDIFEIYYDFADNQFKPKSDVDLHSNHVVYLRNLLDPIRLFDELNNLDKKYHTHAKDLSSKFLNYDLPVVTIKNRRLKEVGIIFERINNTGTKLDVIDLMTAWTWTEDFHLLDSANLLSDELEDKGFGNLEHKLLLQIVAGILIKSTTTNNILTITGEQVRDRWKHICESIRRTVDFLSTDLNCCHFDFLPYNQQLVPLTKFFSEVKHPHEEQIKKLKKWFWITSFSDRYSTGQTTSKMDSDIDAMCKIANKDYSVIDRYSYTVTSNQIIASQFAKTNPLTRAFLLLMAQHSPLDLVKSTKIDLGESLSTYNRKQYHHVFPNSFLMKRGVPKNKRFSLVNFCFLPSASNKQVSTKEPADYFFTMISQDNFADILSSNLLPLKKEIYKENDFENFLSLRAGLIISEVDKIAS